MATATNVTVIPAKPQTANNRSQYKQLRVAAYCRVSTEQEEQQNSYQVQIEYYTNLMQQSAMSFWKMISMKQSSWQRIMSTAKNSN